MTVALLVITDGRRDYLERTIASADVNLDDVKERWMFDDSGDDSHRAWLGARFPEFIHLNAGPRQGFGGAINAAWRHLHRESLAAHVFHLEQDFTFNRPVPLAALAATLNERPHLAQLALRRQAWNPTEVTAGGVIETNPHAYVEVDGAHGRWLEHRLFWTTNPSLYRSELTAVGWPTCDRSEGVFTHQLLADPDLRFGYWGGRDSGEAVHHIGDHRTGIGY